MTGVFDRLGRWRGEGEERSPAGRVKGGKRETGNTAVLIIVVRRVGEGRVMSDKGEHDPSFFFFVGGCRVFVWCRVSGSA